MRKSNPAKKSHRVMADELVLSKREEKKAARSQIEDGVEVVVSDAAEVGEKKMVMLRSEDGEEFLMSDAEASQCGRIIDFRIKYGFVNHIIPSDDGSEANYSPIDLFVRGDTLSKVIEYSKMHASGPQDFSEWDAKFIGHFCHETLVDLILAAKYIRNRGLLHLTCQTVANLVKGKSFDEIRAIFNIRSYVTNRKNTIGAKKVDTLDKWLTATSCPSAEEYPVLTQEENVVRALHIVRCQEFTAYDPKRSEFVCTRFHGYNIAFFDLDKESRIVRGPPFDSMYLPLSTYGVQYSVNVISLKVIESLVGDDLRIFGTVVARDEVDYRCIYLFRREKDDAQAIALPDGMLTLTDPCRGLVLLNQIYFEIDLKIRCDGGEIKDFSRGVISVDSARFPAYRQTMTVGLNSLLSWVDLACAYVVEPVEATIAINILKGPCNISRVSAWVSGDTIILYDSETNNTQTITGDSGRSVPLTRRVVAVPFNGKLVLTLVDDDNAETVHLTIGPSDKESVFVCKMGFLGEAQVKVAWTVIRKRKSYEFEIIGNEMLLHEG